MSKEKLTNYYSASAIQFLQKLLNDAEIDMSVEDFVATYSYNRGIKFKNVLNNIYKHQLYAPGNFKYLRRVVEDRLNFLKENPKR